MDERRKRKTTGVDLSFLRLRCRTHKSTGKGADHSRPELPRTPNQMDFACRDNHYHTPRAHEVADPQRSGVQPGTLANSELKATATPKAPVALHATAPTCLDTHSPRTLAIHARTLTAQVRRTVHAESPAATTKTNRPRRDLPL